MTIAWLGGFLYSTVCVWIWLVAFVAISNICINVHLHPLILFIGLSDRSNNIERYRPIYDSIRYGAPLAEAGFHLGNRLPIKVYLSAYILDI